MKFLFTLLITLGSIITIYAQKPQAYAKFSERPEKRLSSSDISGTNFYVEYQSKKKATIYLELFKGGQSYGFVNETIKSKEISITKLNLIKRPVVDAIPGGGYTLKLRLYEGEKYNLKNLISETVVKDVSVTRLLYTKL